MSWLSEMFSGGGNEAPAPDPRIAQAAADQAALGREYLDFAKQQFRVSQGQQDELNARAREVSDFFLNMGKEDRARWETVYKPIEDQFIKTANEYASPEKQAQEAAKARADVQSAADTERQATARRDQAMGIAPGSGRYAGTERAIGLGTTAATVGAQNQARENVRNKGLALQSDAINMGRGLTGQSAASLQSGLGAAGIPLQGTIASQQIVQPGYSGAMTGLGNYSNTLNNLYKTSLDTWDSENKLKAANISGIGSAIGTAAGLFMMSSRDAKKNIKPVADGSALKAAEDLPIASYDYKPGEGDGGSHVGPMAGDFKRATGQGDGKTIAFQDAIGLALGAVKDLSAKVDQITQAIGLGGKRAMPQPA